MLYNIFTEFCSVKLINILFCLVQTGNGSLFVCVVKLFAINSFKY